MECCQPSRHVGDAATNGYSTCCCCCSSCCSSLHAPSTNATPAQPQNTPTCSASSLLRLADLRGRIFGLQSSSVRPPFSDTTSPDFGSTGCSNAPGFCFVWGAFWGAWRGVGLDAKGEHRTGKQGEGSRRYANVYGMYGYMTVCLAVSGGPMQRAWAGFGRRHSCCCCCCCCWRSRRQQQSPGCCGAAAFAAQT